MSTVLEIDKKKMHDIKSAAKATGYSRDYVTRLAREGKIIATQVKRQWYLDLESLKQYATVSAFEQEIRKRHLSEERRQEQLLTKRVEHNSSLKSKRVVGHEKQTKQAVLALLVAGFFSAIVAGVALLPFVDSARVQVANVYQDSLDSSVENKERVFQSARSTAVFSSGSVQKRTFAEKEDGIMLLPQDVSDEEMLNAVDLFSDDVVVRTASTGQMYISPADTTGSSTGAEIPFVAVPLTNIHTP